MNFNEALCLWKPTECCHHCSVVNLRHQNICISLQSVKNSCVLLGVDWGGLRREWFELLCKALFSHESGFFTRFNEDDPQALVS